MSYFEVEDGNYELDDRIFYEKKKKIFSVHITWETFFFFMVVIQYTFICKYFVTYVNDPICNIKLHQTKRLTK